MMGEIMKDNVKWGVIASGGIARRRTIPEGIIPSANASLVSVYDSRADTNGEVANEFGAHPAESVQELLDGDIDAVYVASPVNKHLEHVMACAEAKKHVLCEKPLGMTVEEAEQMIGKCEREGVLLGTGLMMRFLAQHREAHRLIREGKLGKPVYGRAQLSCWYPKMEGAWRQDPLTGGGGSLIDMGSHCIDLLEMFMGRVKSLNCYIGNNVQNYKSEDSAVVLLLFEDGGMATVDAFFCIPDNSSKNALELYGSRGSILARGTIGQGEEGAMTAFLEDDLQDYDSQQARSNGDGLVISPEPVNMYRAEIEEFCNAVLEGRDPVNSAQVGLRNQKLLAACYESARTGRQVIVN